MAYPTSPERLYDGIDREYAENPEVVLPEKWQFLKVETVLKRDKDWLFDMAPIFSDPEHIRTFVVELLRGLEDSDRERMYVIFADNFNRIVGVHEVHVGTLNESTAHPRELYKAAIIAGAKSVVFVHNHPSGQLKFSKNDLALLRRLEVVSLIVGIGLLDFIVIGHRGEFIAASQQGLLRDPSTLLMEVQGLI